MLVYQLVCFERGLAWRQRSEKGQGSLRGAEGKRQCGQEMCKT